MIEPIGLIRHAISARPAPKIKKSSGRTKFQIVIEVEDKLQQYFVETDTYICPTESGYIKLGGRS